MVMLQLFVCSVAPEFRINESLDSGYVSGFRICKPNVVKQTKRKRSDSNNFNLYFKRYLLGQKVTVQKVSKLKGRI